MTSYNPPTDTELNANKAGVFTLFRRLRDIGPAITEKAAGAPVLANGYVVEAMLAANAVSQAKMKTSTANQSVVDIPVSTDAVFVFTGSTWTIFWSIGDNSAVSANQLIFNAHNATYGDAIRVYNNSGSVISAFLNERYISASPPWDLGDGQIPLFVFVRLNSAGKIRRISVACDPPWAYHGPTNIAAEIIRGGKAFRRKMESARGIRGDRAKLVEFRAARNPATAEMIEITDAVKNADMGVVPSPFMLGARAADDVDVLIDPVSDLAEELLYLHEEGENIPLLLERGEIIFDNAALNRIAPPGVMPVSARWKLTI